MSKQTIEKFFPAFTKFLTTQVPNGSLVFHDILFPDATAETCPEITISTPQVVPSFFLSGEVNEIGHAIIIIRQPMLLLAAIGGIVVGFYGAIQLSSSSSSSTSISKNNYTWVVSYAAFGIMNISAIWIHCLLEAPAPGRSYPEEYPLLWMLDTYMTGVAASALTVACFKKSHDDNDVENDSISVDYGWDFMFWTLQGLGLVALVDFIGHYLFWIFDLIGLSFLSALWLKTGKGRIPTDRPSMAGTDALEMWYLLPPLNATIVAIQLLFGPIVVRNPTTTTTTTRSFTFFPQWKDGHRGNDASRHWTTAHIIFIISLILPSILGIGLDRFWCWAIRSRAEGGVLSVLGDLLTASTMTFLGCDLAYLAILLWLIDKQKKDTV
ncbi:unnamed protein product [Cylindrotheca closterium]|uniref:Uncharacterized protein n=1 Tax=Cylindrotheca closterium TaxID=2856 RepID=A0AAD2G5I7_9STRA|nr:unnamed protein product [Cylindrotheca closterium]